MIELLVSEGETSLVWPDSIWSDTPNNAQEHATKAGASSNFDELITDETEDAANISDVAQEKRLQHSNVESSMHSTHNGMWRQVVKFLISGNACN